ncbi:transposase, partial [Xanthomonas oryzae]
PGQRQSISAASAVNSKGGFWFAVYSGGMNGELFVALLKRMMKGRRRPIHLVLDGLPAHKTRGVRDDVDSLKGRLTLHFLPGDAQDLNPDELVWSYTKRTGVARSPLRSGEKLADRVHDQLSDIAVRPELVRSFFRHPSVAYISDL